MSDDKPVLVRHLDEVPVEQWEDRDRGGASWRTLFSQHVTGTSTLSTGVSEVPVGSELALHRHATVESYFFLEGRGVLELDGESHEVRAGTSALMPSLVPHAVRNTGSEVLRFFYAFAADSFTHVEYEFLPEATN